MSIAPLAPLAPLAPPLAYWTLSASEAARAVEADGTGLSQTEARRRLALTGPNEVRGRQGSTRLVVLWRQLRNPLVLLLVFASIASSATGEWTDAVIVGAILLASVGVGYHREYQAETAIGALLDRLQITAIVVRDGEERPTPVRDVVPGDLVMLSAGSIVPGDAVLVRSKELYINDAVLTGESFPVAKEVGTVAATASLRERTGCVYFGTNVRSGTATALVVATGASTAFGGIAQTLASTAPETELERGLRRFGLLLVVTMLAMVIVVFAIHTLMGHPPVETLLFSIALAVGLSPELLPAIVSVNLSRAAQELAERGVLVRRLDAIENLGSMDVLCTDKTGTLTEGVASVDGGFDPAGAPSAAVLELAVRNAALTSGLPNPIDAALVDARPPELEGFAKLGEVPYDFMRKRVSVVVAHAGVATVITKGAFDHVLEVCTQLPDGSLLDDARRAALVARYEAWCADGVRVIAVATGVADASVPIGFATETALSFAGFVTFLDRVKPDAVGTVSELATLGVRVKMISGDSRLVASHVARTVGLASPRVLTGAELDALTEVALVRLVEDVDVYAEVDPNHKERILRALRRAGSVVGFFGDGVNDAPAMHAADVSISVDTAVDVAKATADLVLVEKGLQVIVRGIQHGRRTFSNTLKYILTTTSANLGNMISMAVASLVLPFLPLTAGQILLNNFLSDIPAFGIASDRVDPELTALPRRWDLKLIGAFMLQFGLLSSAFDALTFVVLLRGFGADAHSFRTGWFVESLFTELAIALVVRTRRRAWQSRPSSSLAWATAAVAILAFALPYLPFSGALGFIPAPPAMMGAIVGITAAYVLASEVLKASFYRTR